MSTLQRAGESRELRKLIALYLQAETDIINEIGRLRSLGLADYHAVSALDRVQAILRKLEDDSWTYAPRMIEREFYVRHPEARCTGEPVSKHLAAYANAQALTAEQTFAADQLVMNLMGELTEASVTAMHSVQSAVLGRAEQDLYRRVGLEQAASAEVLGRGLRASAPDFVEALRRDGVTAFVDRAGRRWSLHTYASMVLRTTSRQAQTMAALTRDPEQDLYRIISHGTGCALCAPYEGRVYSKSGTHPIFPPLSAAFGKRDPAGPDTLENTWLNIHPNCLHTISPWTPAGKTEEALREIERFSNPRTNPFDRDPRTQRQIAAYRRKEAGRRRWLEQYRQWEKYRQTLGDPVPKTFHAFQKHKLAGDETYRAWENSYRRTNAEQEKARLEHLQSVRHHQDRKAAVRALIQSDQVPKELNVGHQNKHIKASGQYVTGKSYLYGDLDTAQSLVEKYHGTGEPIFTRKGDWAKKEVISQGKVIGVDVDMQTGTETETRRFTIHYGKKGTHVVPAKEKS